MQESQNIFLDDAIMHKMTLPFKQRLLSTLFDPWSTGCEGLLSTHHLPENSDIISAKVQNQGRLFKIIELNNVP